MKKITQVLSILVAVGTLSSANATQCVSQNGDPETHYLLRFEASLAGELDPNVLGDGGLLVFASPFTNDQITVLETNEDAPIANQLEKYNGQGLLVYLKKSCLKAVTAKQKSAILDLKKSVLKIKGKSDVYKM